jgi:hypothetical protein
MSEITITVRDATRDLHTRTHASRVDYLVAALSADPETIEELQAALKRYMHSHSSRPFFDGWRPGVDSQPWDAGVCIIDLPARLVVVQSTYSEPGPRGGVEIDAGEERLVAVPYHLAEDWLFLQDVEGWESKAAARREDRLRLPPLDARSVFYGKVCEFIVPACAADARCAGSPCEDEGAWRIVSEIHARWLTEPRDDLRGLAPRDVLLQRHDHMVWDMQDRCHQWSMLGGPPPPLSKESAAYRFGGFGTHEIVLYYDLVRFLLNAHWDRVVAGQASSDPAEATRWLDELRDTWLNSPGVEDLHGRTPASVIERERVRLPEAMTRDEAVIDHDCPMCQMMADLPGPMFWHLDGCNMDEGFAFSFHRTREEWEAEQREYEEMSRRIDERLAARAAEPNSPWQTSYADPDAADAPPVLAMYAFAANLGELTLNLKEAGAPPETIDLLNRSFGNVRDVVEPPNTDLLGPVVEKMCDAVAAVGEAYPLLAEKTGDLERRLRDFARRRVEPPEFDDIPF